MPIELLPETPSQTAGPYVHIGLALEAAGVAPRPQEIWNQLAKPDAPGEHILLFGHVYDGNGHLVRDSFLEIWQANHEGVYDTRFDLEKSFNSFGRTATTFDAGEWTLQTVKPGVVKNAAGVPMAPHINVLLFARGINIHLHTRIYFDDEVQANQDDPVLNLIEQPQRRQTLIAKRCEVNGNLAYRFDMRIQGEGETVFFDC
ncbi:UNVERIFIED_ORG: protocatechuate 3,4-dioxygenase alpha subunit [Pseudomonas parafulva]|jgi:protocatechuate 3,4-dioxygenase, alpha subunit|uniref:Protocatechuate 3,4-dioxygenase subunit alpha n=1 Tax=Pseudomonas fulva TaxID=47880 RepID=A0A2L1WEK0_9PSED|nr:MULTISPECIES: protocatechuate 3,4-dioxygenase subunit alpha [Pseudomonas]MCY4124136.1 protocatechuate 3,4-dioxygenase subunit alpha [Pseudomonas sp.]MDP9555770.1 protocatechuate 3,4-dioxygenase alpha subunit [Pseudomonas parafulva]AVF55871.1 protocatechuate 3,4-dioxygenase subunit alpha [Pseudomonas fulva]MBA1208081.1 protocatechuate 3,4-dioxygenase subunit alpha [Pseudomonas fulva]MBA1216611.1 protocatechuate 3,4-dioxygenase subunit alpha [Pseudomonas fulva]